MLGLNDATPILFHNNNRVAFLEIMSNIVFLKLYKELFLLFCSSLLKLQKITFLIFYTTLPNLQMCRNRHLLDCLISFYLIDK